MSNASDAPIIDGIDDLIEIGRGGFAIVYRGHQSAFRRDVAVKVLSRSGLDADDRRRFERECQAMGLLSDHPGIVTLFDAGFTADGRPYMVMSYVAGGSLSSDLTVRGPMSWQDVIQLGVRLSGALETAHRADVLHRDIKPANILRSDYGEQLSDFGIARIAGGHETRSGIITASLAHAAPEILDGARPTVGADVYSLASTLYEAVSGQAAFVRDTDETLLPLIRRVITDPIPDLTTSGVPEPLARVIEVAMAKDPADRYESAAAFGLALQNAQTALGITASELAIVGEATPSAEPEPAPEPEPALEAVPTDVPPVVPPPPPPVSEPPPPAAEPEPRRSRVLAVASIGLLAALAAVALFVVTRDDTPDDVPGAPDELASRSATPTTPPTGDAGDAAVLAAADQGRGSLTIIVEGHFAPQIDSAISDAVDLADSDPNSDSTLQVTTSSQLLEVLQTAAEDGFDPVVVLGSRTASDVTNTAAQHLETMFVIIDGFVKGRNVVSIEFADNEAAFLAGVAAARASVERRVGFLGGSDDEYTQVHEAGFVAGVRHEDPSIQIDVRYLDDRFEDPAAAFDVTTAMLDSRADVIYHVIGESGSGAIEAAAAHGSVWTIGSEIDWHQLTAAEQQSFVLTSTLKGYDAVLTTVLESASTGPLVPGRTVLGLADGVVDLSTAGGFVEGIQTDLDNIREALSTGLLEAPRTVGLRAVAPLGTECPVDGCIIRMLGIEPVGTELAVTLEANWVMNTGALHAHYYWSPTYSAEQVGGDSTARFGVPVGSWDLDDSFPVYTTENAASRSLRGSATHLCVTAADNSHNVIDPALFSCIEVG